MFNYNIWNQNKIQSLPTQEKRKKKKKSDYNNKVFTYKLLYYIGIKY